MSEFRLFCIGFFVGSSGLAAAINHGLKLRAADDNAATLILVGLIVGAISVAFLGHRK